MRLPISSLVLASLLGFSLPAMAEGPAPASKIFSVDQNKEIERIVADYIKKHPEVIAHAMEDLQKREEAASAEAAKKVIASVRAELTQSTDDIVLGNPKGDVTMVEFYDYRCGYCKKAEEPIAAILKDDSKLRVVLKSWPVLGPDSVTAARAVLAAKNQGTDKQLALHVALMAAKNPIDETKVMALAKELGLDVDRLKTDMADAKITAMIDKTRARASKLNIGGTPTFVLGEQILPGVDTAENFRKAIAMARKGS
jgi:protein-disulfide isomerase